MNRRDATLALGMLAAPVCAKGLARRIAILMSGSEATSGYAIDAIREGFKGIGWVEGRDFVLLVRWANGDTSQLADLAGELMALKPALFITPATLATQAARRLTAEIPIVFVVVPDPEGSGLIASLARPGGNVTGLSTMSVDLSAKRMQLFKEAIPSLTTLVILDDSTANYNAKGVEALRNASLRLGIETSVERASTEGELNATLERVSLRKPDGVIVMDNVLFLRHRKAIAARLTASRIPTFFSSGDYVDDGGFLAYGVTYRDRYRRAAIYVDNILNKGIKPGDLPVELPKELELMINLKTAKALGVAVPRTVLLRANRLIE